MSPYVTVLLPVYNAGPYLTDAVESILSQTFPDFELLICDDGSTDGSREIAEQFALLDSRIRVLAPGRLGFAGILNVGLQEARGRFVARMDADDVSLCDRLALQINFLDHHREVGAVGGQADTIDASGLPNGEWLVQVDHHRIDQDHIEGWNVQMIHPTVTMRTDLLRKLGGYREEAKWVEDIDLWLRMAESSQLANLSSKVLKYRVLRDSYSNGNSLKTGQAFTAIATEARRRRGLPYIDLPPPFWVNPTPRDPYDRAVAEGRAALKRGDVATAKKISFQLLRQRPWSKRAWSIALGRVQRSKPTDII